MAWRDTLADWESSVAVSPFTWHEQLLVDATSRVVGEGCEYLRDAVVHRRASEALIDACSGDSMISILVPSDVGASSISTRLGSSTKLAQR